MKIYLLRLYQTITFGWQDTEEIANKFHLNRLALFMDVLKSFLRWRVRSMQYFKERFWELSQDEKEKLGKQYMLRNVQSDRWMAECYENYKFLNKWKDYKWNTSGTRYHKRLMAYTKRYNMGRNCIVHYDVVLERNHGLNGSITIGNNVILQKHVYIDYSGEVVIGDNVQITNGTIIETHHHASHSNPFLSGDIITPTKLVIADGVVIGSRSIILSSCHYIGRNSRIGAGAVITKDVPDNAIVVGVPGKIVRIINQTK
jgi:acetyltransferase-like isoleucine patch superfamily enzyme